MPRKGGAHQQALAQAVLRVAPGRAHQRECEVQHLAALLDAVGVAGGGGRLVICIELAQDGVQCLVARRRERLVSPPLRGRWGRARAHHACGERPGGARVPHRCPVLVCRPAQAERCYGARPCAAMRRAREPGGRLEQGHWAGITTNSESVPDSVRCPDATGRCAIRHRHSVCALRTSVL